METRLFVGLLALCTATACGTPDRKFNTVAEGGSDDGADSSQSGKSGSKATGKAGSTARGGSPSSSGSDTGGTAGTSNGGSTDGGTSSGGSGGQGGMSGGTGGVVVDLCVGKVCNTPPPQDCLSATQLTSFDTVGSCHDGECSYASHAITCSCANDACSTDPCIGLACVAPPLPICKDADTLRTSAAHGTCSGGSCDYATTDEDCEFGCSNGACNPDPCQGVMCKTQPPATCKDASTKTTFASSGTCDNGDCSYGSTDTPCGSNKSCSGAGVCNVCAADASCGASCTACGGSTPRCKNLGTTSQCVKCVTNQDCTSASAPVCNLSTNTCVARPSCVGLAATCGPSGNGDCCATGAVPGGTFFRNYDGGSPGTYGKDWPATVSNFKLDTYEITVGRFRKFVAAYSQNMLPAGAGKNPNNASDNGWDTANNSKLEANAAALVATVANQPYSTYNATAGSALEESRPVNYLGYYEAAAFCIWDGGRLPTEAEWNYAASGGSEQRVYAWGNTAPGANTLLMNWGCYYGNNTATCSDVSNISRVGSIAAGFGKWGHADLNGNLFEIIVERSGGIPMPCNDCGQVTGSDANGSMVRGGCFYESDANNLINSYRGGIGITGSTFSGARCAL
ncbi:MAG TPA: SUMF1/EgtB/PvdO family nonheme iron enzyme [Polyangiaceae bacterium]|nr:SUMF1/EgtB/PvdO family nonheme iron enzyme [Polyangiaceae bacterium]